MVEVDYIFSTIYKASALSNIGTAAATEASTFNLPGPEYLILDMLEVDTTTNSWNFKKDNPSESYKVNGKIFTWMYASDIINSSSSNSFLSIDKFRQNDISAININIKNNESVPGEIFINFYTHEQSTGITFSNLSNSSQLFSDVGATVDTELTVKTVTGSVSGGTSRKFDSDISNNYVHGIAFGTNSAASSIDLIFNYLEIVLNDGTILRSNFQQTDPNLFQPLGTVLNSLTDIKYGEKKMLTSSDKFYITYDIAKRYILNETPTGEDSIDTTHTITENNYLELIAFGLNQYYTSSSSIPGGYNGEVRDGNSVLTGYRSPYVDPENYALEVFDTSQSEIYYKGSTLQVSHTWRLTYGTITTGTHVPFSTILYGNVETDDTLNIVKLTPSGIPIQTPVSGWSKEGAEYNLTLFGSTFEVLSSDDPTLTAGTTTGTRIASKINSDNSFSVETITTESGEGGGGGDATGDPYITTFSGKTYKMDDFTGFVRMLQGTIDNKLFTINAETNLLTKEEITDLIIMRNKTKKTSVLEPQLCNDKFPAYFTKLYVQWGDDNMIIDLKQHNIISDTRNQDYELVVSNVQEYNWSNKTSKAIKMMIPFGEVTLVVKKFDNLDLRNGFTVLNHEKIENRSGALEHTIYTKDIKLKKLNTLTPLKRLIDRAPKRFSKETFNESKNFSRIVELPIF